MQITLPEKLAKRLKELGIEPEMYVIDNLVSLLNLNREEEIELHVELAEKLLKEGESIIDKDPV